jgi:periplasmic protein TonB
MVDESITIRLRDKILFIKNLFKVSFMFSLTIHLIFAAGYAVSRISNGTEEETPVNGFEIERPDIEMDIPPELIGGDSSPAPVEKSEWIEGSKKTGAEPVESDINTNQISGNGTDKDGYLFSFNGDSPPRAIVDFDLRQYYPPEAKSANIKNFQVTVLIQVDENGLLISENIASGKAPYGFNEQALKVVNKMRFSPGYKKGKRVKMTHYLPITFTLE